MRKTADINAHATDKPLRAQYARILAGLALQGDDISGQAFWSAAWDEGVGACVWHALQQRSVMVDAQLRKTCIEQELRTRTAHTLLLRAAAAGVLRLFADAGIAVVMLRGQAVADVLYAPPSLRPQTDIDLLINAPDCERVADTLAGAGFRSVPHYPLLFYRGDILLDVHTEPLGIERMASWSRLTPLRAGDFFAHARRGNLLGEPAVLPDAPVMLPYLCFHAMKHSFERLLWLWDIALLARKIGENKEWDSVQAGIKAYGLSRPCFYALSYAHAHLAAEIPAPMLDSLRPRMDWRERQIFRRFMAHEQVPFLAERVFARMQPDFLSRLAFWKETIWPRAEVREQMDADPSARGGFIGKRLVQIGRAATLLSGELSALFRR